MTQENIRTVKEAIFNIIKIEILAFIYSKYVCCMKEASIYHEKSSQHLLCVKQFYICDSVCVINIQTFSVLYARFSSPPPLSVLLDSLLELKNTANGIS